MQTPRLYDSIRYSDPVANVAVVGNLTVLIRQIEREEVLVVLHPNVQTFQAGEKTQESEFHESDETVNLMLGSANSEVQVSVGGAKYAVSIAEIGSESKPKATGHLDYCVLDITRLPD